MQLSVKDRLHTTSGSSIQNEEFARSISYVTSGPSSSVKCALRSIYPLIFWGEAKKIIQFWRMQLGIKIHVYGFPLLEVCLTQPESTLLGFVGLGFM